MGWVFVVGDPNNFGKVSFSDEKGFLKGCFTPAIRREDLKSFTNVIKFHFC